ncbi:PAS domain-containing protein, partial [Burkholderia ubonensis]
IVHLSDRAGRFLQYSGGEPSHNIIAAVRPELRLELRTAIYQALHTNRSVEARRVRIEREARSYFVNMTARPVHDPEANADFVLVLFDEVEDSMSSAETATADTQKDPIITQLDRPPVRSRGALPAVFGRRAVAQHHRGGAPRAAARTAHRDLPGAAHEPQRGSAAREDRARSAVVFRQHDGAPGARP